MKISMNGRLFGNSQFSPINSVTSLVIENSSNTKERTFGHLRAKIKKT